LKENSFTLKSHMLWLMKMAWRDAKASSVRLILFMASIILGIAAVVSIQLFSRTLQDNIQEQSKVLIGADFIIDSRQLPNKRAQAIIDSLAPGAREVNFVSMVVFPGKGGTKLARVRGMAGAFPLYGSITTQPEAAATRYQEAGGALVDATLMLQFGVSPGDSIKIGEVTLPIVGALKSIPGRSAISTTVAPPVIIPYRFIEKTRLLQFGSRKEYQFYYKAPDLDLVALEKKLQPMLEAEDADLDTHTSTSERIGRGYDNVTKFLNLAAFIALLLGCVGIASSVNIYIKEKLKAIAVLKCLGASRRQSFLIFLLQIAGIGIVGGVIGTIIGVSLQEIFPYILKDFLPFSVETSITAAPLFMGVLLGFFMSVLFALLPLIHTWYVSPLEVLRIGSTPSEKPEKARLAVLFIIVLFLYLFSFWLLKNWLYALAFVLGVLITFAVLAGIAKLAMRMVKSFFPKRAAYTLRQSLLNLYRPNNQTLVLLVAIGLGTFLISTLYFTKDILLAKTALDEPAQNANLIALDVQTGQVKEVAATFKSNNLPVINNIPLVTMRMHSIKGRSINELKQDTTGLIGNDWILSHEFRTTYRDTLIASESLIEGEWTPTQSTQEPIKISVSDNLADDARVTVGDTIVFNVQGVLMETIVGSIRKVDWARLQLNYTIVFPKGVLEKAPQFNVLTTYAANEEISANFQRDLVAKFPNVSVIDLRQVFFLIEDILNKISWIINFMAFFSILTGIIVLIGSVRTSKHQRIKESVLLRTLGGTNRQILRISALEYLFLGVLGSLVGILLALAGSLLLAVFVFKEPFVPSSIPFLVFLPGISLLVLAIGLSNIQSVLRSSPLEVLRREQ
jgi:putative ABC transport system permease protein